MTRDVDSQVLVVDRGIYYVCKRGLDIGVALLMLLLLAPLLLVIALLIKLDSSGPAIFSQERVRLKREVRDGRETWVVGTFTCYKFRTMRHKASCDLHRDFVQAFIKNDEQRMAEMNGNETTVRKLVEDPRVTRVGHLLRCTSLDELPQLWNVLKGDMTLVGPRPALPYEVEIYQPRHFLRLQTVPGLTGMWQISARSAATFDEMVEMDIWYIEHQSLWLDLSILLKTPIVVLLGKGAV